MTLKECSIRQSNQSILSKVIEYTDRQIQSRKPVFRIQGVSKCGDLLKTAGGGGEFNTNFTFSDENVKWISKVSFTYEFWIKIKGVEEVHVEVLIFHETSLNAEIGGLI